ncbi:MAG: 16S rRNA (guanine(966)-N(2))-methyltransferase RsmD [Candidatus Omnitrophota bacterium]|nr:MAG: 16S rRNA (guanine(966)-N(2))-methyltransferase RsmD [Candidatus Omnitrophota bacterium]
MRPTTERVKTALFNLLTEKIKDAYVLDLFAGTGGLGIKALEKGAREVVFVERDRRCSENIRRRLKKLGFYDFQIICTDFRKALNLLRRRKKRFEIVLADPPYQQGFEGLVLQNIGQYAILLENGILAIEHYKKSILPSEAGNLRLYKRREYGDTVLSLYENCHL